MVQYSPSGRKSARVPCTAFSIAVLSSDVSRVVVIGLALPFAAALDWPASTSDHEVWCLKVLDAAAVRLRQRIIEKGTDQLHGAARTRGLRGRRAQLAVSKAAELEEVAPRQRLRGLLAVVGRRDRVVLAGQDQGRDVARHRLVLDRAGRRHAPEVADVQTEL